MQMEAASQERLERILPGPAPSADAELGRKTIGFFAGVVLLVNNITGAGVPALPNLVAESGWLPPLICTLACVLLTSLAAGMFAEAMRRIPGNDAFGSRFEYAGIVRSYAGDRAYLAA